MAPILEVAEIVKTRNGRNVLLTNTLNRIFDQPGVKDKKVVIYSIAGASGSGKSFLLNVFLHKLKSGTQNSQDESTTFVEHFETASNINSTTFGIRMTTKPIFLSQDETTAIFFMDTQGFNTFEFKINQDSVIYAISNMLSSVQIINCCNKIDARLIDQLGDFIRAAKQSHVPQPQCQMMLVRDWSRPTCIPYGLDAEHKYFAEPGIADNDVIAELTGSNDQLECFLMPYPGEKVATRKTCNFKDINRTARTFIDQLFQHLFSPGNVKVKKINGVEVTCGELVEVIEKVFPDPSNISVEVMNEGHQRSFVNANIKKSAQTYKQSMQNSQEDHTSDERFQTAHENAKELALKTFEAGLINREKQDFRHEFDESIIIEYETFEGRRIITSLINEWKKSVDEPDATSQDDLKAETEKTQKAFATKMEQIRCESVKQTIEREFENILDKKFVEEKERRLENGKWVIRMASNVCQQALNVALPTGPVGTAATALVGMACSEQETVSPGSNQNSALPSISDIDLSLFLHPPTPAKPTIFPTPSTIEDVMAQFRDPTFLSFNLLTNLKK